MAKTAGLTMQNMNVINLGNENFSRPMALKSSKQGIQYGKQRKALSNVSNRENHFVDKLASRKQPQVKQLTKSKASSDLKSLVSSIEEESLVKDVEAMDIPDVYSDMVHAMGKSLPTVKDVDKEDVDCPMMCAEYVKDVYSYLHAVEKKLEVSDYMHKQVEIHEKMRSILVDWLVQVHQRFGLLQETLYLTVYILDRFLSKVSVQRSKLQLAGVSSMLLASKYEETYAPEIGDFVYITDNSYTKTDIKQMETEILKALDFDLSHPLCLHFLRRNSKVAGADAQKHTLSKYLMELTLPDYDAARYLPSEVAASACCLSAKLLDGVQWDDTLEYYTGYSEEQLIPCMKKLATLVKKAESSKLQAVRSKYSGSKFMKISKIPELSSELVQTLAET